MYIKVHLRVFIGSSMKLRKPEFVNSFTMINNIQAFISQFVRMGSLKTFIISVILCTFGAYGAVAQNYERTTPHDQSGDMPRFEVSSAVTGSDGTMFMIDRRNGNLFVFDKEGVLKNTVNEFRGEPGSVGLRRPVAIALDHSNRLFIADDRNNEVYAIDSETFELLMKIGDRGRGPGEFRNIVDITVDHDGYLYVLDDSNERIDIFDQDGNFINWITGLTQNIPREFNNPVSIGIDGLNYLYVLETRPGRVHKLNMAGNHELTFAQFSESMNRVKSMVVFDNGHFAVLEEDTGAFNFFNSGGELLQRSGRQGRNPSPGIFREATKIVRSLQNPHELHIIDPGANVVQTYSYDYEPDDPTLRIDKFEVTTDREPVSAFHDAVFTENGRVYLIPEGNQSEVVALDLETRDVIFRVPVDQAHRLATDDDANLYVLDTHRRSREVKVFNNRGIFQFSVGQEISDPFRDPDDLVVLSDRSIVVADYRRESLYRWSGSGVFQSRMNMSDYGLESFKRLRADSQDNVYILDGDEKTIYRFKLDEGVRYPVVLSVYGLDPSSGKSEILWFDIDKSDQIHIFNEDTHQYHLYSWKIGGERTQYPQLQFRTGREGSDNRSFNRAQAVALNPYLMEFHVTQNRGRDVRTLGLLRRPPQPDIDQFYATVEDGFLKLSMISTGDVIVTGLAVEPEGSGHADADARWHQSGESVLLKNEAQSDQLLQYRISAESFGSFSQPSEPFYDYFGLAKYYASNSDFDSAFEQVVRAMDYYNLNEASQAAVAELLAGWGETVSRRGDGRLATLILRKTSALADDESDVHERIAQAFKELFNTKARRGEYAAIIRNLDNIKGIESQLVRDETLPELLGIAGNLTESNSENRISQGLRIYSQLAGWHPSNAEIPYLQGTAHFRLFEALNRGNAPYHVMNLRLNQALSATERGLAMIEDKGDLYNDTRLLELRIKTEMRNFTAVIDTAEKELSEQVPGLDESYVAQYYTLAGNAMMQTGDYSGAVYNFTMLLQLDEDNEEYLNYLAMAYLNNEQPEEARTMFRQLHIGNPDAAEYVGWIGQAEYELGNYAEATYQLEQAIEMNPKKIEFYGMLARAYFADRKYNESLEKFEISLSELRSSLEEARNRQAPQQVTRGLRDEISTNLLLYGRANMRMRNYARATSIFEELTDMHSDNGEYWYELGEAYRNNGAVYNAEDAFFRASNLDSGNDQFRRAYDSARETSDSYAAGQDPVRILNMNIDPIFPSLYRNYASSQSIGEMLVENNTEQVIANARLELSIGRFGAETLTVDLPVLSPRSNTSVPLFVSLDESILRNSSDQTVQLSAEIKYTHDGSERSATNSTNAVVHRRSAISWSDKRSLAAFISPGNDKIRSYVSSLNASFSGVADFDLPENIVRAIRVYTGLNNSGFVYQLDPNIGTRLQTGVLDDIQYPIETLQIKSGECDDFVTLFANLLESQGIRTAYIDVPGHVFFAFDTELSPLDIETQGLDPDRFIIRSDRVWMPVETTLIGRAPFHEAWRSGSDRWNEEFRAGNMPQLVAFEAAWRIYEPANFTPEGADLEFEINPEMEAEYENILRRIFDDINQGKKDHLYTRLQADPENLYLLNRYGVLLARSGDQDEAYELFNTALEINPQNASVHNNLANLYFQKRDYVRATHHYLSATQADESNPLLYVNLSRAYLELGNLSSADEAFSNAVALDETIKDLYDFIYNRINP